MPELVPLSIKHDECRPRGGSITIQKTPCPPCLGEALRRESFVLGRFSWFRCERIGSCPFLQSQKIHLYALIIAILQRFNLKKNSPHSCRESQDHLYYFVPDWRADAIDHEVVAAWRWKRKQGEPPHKLSTARSHVYIR